MGKRENPAAGPMANYTWEDLANKIDGEGFDYFFTQYDNFTDPELKRLATAYRAAAAELEKYLQSKGGLL